MSTLLCLGTTPAQAKYASLVVDADTGQVLHGTNEDTRNYPASLTKMMTLYLVFDRLKQKRWSLNDKLKVSARAAMQPASKLGLPAGSTITVEEAILALVTKSANDVATVVAENIGGRERNFALKMTAKARSLGMSKTTFRNASGLPHRAQLSTASDIAVLARALLRDFPEYYHYFSTTKFTYAGQTYGNHNKLLETYPGTDGFKTGYIRASGFNLVASSTKNGRRIIGVVFGGRSPNQRNDHMTNLLDKGFEVLAGQHGTPMIANLAVPVPPETPTRVAAVANTAPGSNDLWAVQVGAFSRIDQARAAADKAVHAATKYLRDGQIRIVPLQKRNGSILHRARIVGISKSDAYRTCRILKDCMELRSTETAELASMAE
ncbi:MAG: D-alanyl-D-alanine carboxypeptidase family protein [Rhodospirillales bacterium]